MVGCVPSRSGVDRVGAALAALEGETDLRDGNGFEHGVDIDVGRMAAGLARCDHHADAVCAHVCERHWWAGLSSSRSLGEHGLGG
jgi:hypothetical protein